MPKKNNKKTEEGGTEESIPELGSGWKRVGKKGTQAPLLTLLSAQEAKFSKPKVMLRNL